MKILILLFTTNLQAAEFFLRPQAGVALNVINVKSSNPLIAVNKVSTLEKTAGLIFGLEGDRLSIYGDVQYELIEREQNSSEREHSMPGVNTSIGASFRLGPIQVSGSYIVYSSRNAGSHVYKGNGLRAGLSLYGKTFYASAEVSYKDYDLTYNGVAVDDEATSMSIYTHIGMYLF